MIREDLTNLIRIQEIDSIVQKFEEEIAGLEGKLGESAKENEERKTVMEDAKKHADDLKREIRNNESKLRLIESDIKKLTDKVYTVKSQKELESLNHELKFKREEKGSVEDRILTSMDEIESSEINQKKREEEFAKKAEEFNIIEKELNSQIDDKKRILEEINKEKESILGRIPNELCNTYKKTKQSKKGVGVCPVIDGSCSGCHIRIPPQTINEIRKMEVVVRCEACSRILFCK